MQTIKIVLVGLGNLGRRFCEQTAIRRDALKDRYGLDLVLVGAADSRGAAYDPAGLDMAAVAQLKTDGKSVAEYPGAGKPGMDARELVREADADILLEASPVNLDQGAEPAITCIRTALNKGMHVSTPNKGPLVVAFEELHELARANNVKLRYDGTVAGGLAAINGGARDLRGAVVDEIEAVPNLTTGLVMDFQADGHTWDKAVELAREAGALEGDGKWDLEGWDTAAKLVILVNSVMGYPAKMEDVNREGVVGISAETLQAAVADNKRYRLLAHAKRQADGSVSLSAVPVALDDSHELGRLGLHQIGVVYNTDIFGKVTMIIEENSPIPSAMTMLRDLLDIYVEA